MSRFSSLALAVVALVLSGCASASGEARAIPSRTAGRAAHVLPGLTTAERRRADELVSEFENSTTSIPYCHVEALGDGRGYTVGRAGFTSATGDLLEVAERYARIASGNPLQPLLPRLRELARHGDGSTAGLQRLPSAWRATCREPRQHAVQDAVVDELYYLPAVRLWRSLRLRTPLSLAALYDAMVQHGDGDDPDGVPALVRRATRRLGGRPSHTISERRYLLAFLAARRADLAHAYDPASRPGFAQSVDRVDVWTYLVRTRQWRLASPVRVRTTDYTLTLR